MGIGDDPSVSLAAARRRCALNIIWNYHAGPALLAQLAGLRAQDYVVDVCTEQDDARLFELLPRAEVLWHCLRPVNRAVLDAAPKLRLVQKIGVGVNTIDLEHAKARGIAVCNMPGTNSIAVAEQTLALMLAALRRLREFDVDVRAGHGWSWSAERMDGLFEIHGRTVGLIGFGGVPQRLAPVLSAMGAKVLYTARSAKSNVNAEFVSLDRLLSESDIVSLHVPFTEATRNLINADALARMRRGSILVNTARGALIDQEALADALRRGHIGAAGLDVLVREPTAAVESLFDLPNAVLTPHVAWLTQETLTRSLDVAVANCNRLQGGEPLLHRIV